MLLLASSSYAGARPRPEMACWRVTKKNRISTRTEDKNKKSVPPAKLDAKTMTSLDKTLPTALNSGSSTCALWETRETLARVVKRERVRFSREKNIAERGEGKFIGELWSERVVRLLITGTITLWYIRNFDLFKRVAMLPNFFLIIF